MNSLIKGTGAAGFKKGLDQIFGSGYFDRKMKELDPKWDAMILPSSWYNVSNIYKLSFNAAQEKGEDKKKFIVDLSENILENDLNSVYKFFIKLGGPERVLSAFPQIASSYANYQKEKIVINKKGYFQCLVEVPSDLIEFVVYTHEGALKGILKACGHSLKSFNIISKEYLVKESVEYTILNFEVNY